MLKAILKGGTVELTEEQKRILTLRSYYAQMGINYDKATRHFLERHSVVQAVEDPRPTLKIPVAVIEELRLRLVSPE